MMVVLVFRLFLTDCVYGQFCNKQDYYTLMHWESQPLYNKQCNRPKSAHRYFENDRSALAFNEWMLPARQLLINSLPVDEDTRIVVRQVREAIFSKVLPRPLVRNPRLMAYSKEAITNLLDLDHSAHHDMNFVNFVTGNTLVANSDPIAHRYGGHQFGYWSGQLGDGRAHLLGEYVNTQGQRWELQLKGSGLTPYSRRGDGYAVIRSSVREFLCSEAMYHLGELSLCQI